MHVQLHPPHHPVEGATSITELQLLWRDVNALKQDVFKSRKGFSTYESAEAWQPFMSIVDGLEKDITLHEKLATLWSISNAELENRIREMSSFVYHSPPYALAEACEVSLITLLTIKAARSSTQAQSIPSLDALAQATPKGAP